VATDSETITVPKHDKRYSTKLDRITICTKRSSYLEVRYKRLFEHLLKHAVLLSRTTAILCSYSQLILTLNANVQNDRTASVSLLHAGSLKRIVKLNLSLKRYTALFVLPNCYFAISR
jgi:hypothetical protein